MSDLDPANLNKLKVAELRDELKARGLDTKGNKPQLIKRLQEALAVTGDQAEEEATGSGEEEEDLDESASAEPESQQDPETMKTESEEPEDAQAVETPQSEQAAPAAEPVAVKEEVKKEPQAAEPESDQKGEQMEHSGLAESEQNQTDNKEADLEGEEAEFQITDAVGDDNEQPEADQKQEERRGHKRRHSRSRSKSPHKSRSPPAKAPKEAEVKEEWITATNVLPDRFNCDLNMRIDDYKCSPITVEGFAFMWSGVRANYGVSKGKAAFQVKIVENLNVDHLPPEETSRHVVRVGWSTDDTSMQLGEEKLSYGYGGTAKASTDCKFNNYGQQFGEGDVITACLDFESDPVTMSFGKNGEDLGTCFEIAASDLEGKALFPHVLSKNCEFTLNFGQEEEPPHAVPEGFTYINNIPEADRVRGALPPAKKEECEIIMMCGLPGAGKTVWANKHAAENPEKRFAVLGTNNIIEKMKVMGLPRKRNYSGRWDVLIDKSTKCLNRMLEIASKRKSNYILDQTNVYPNAQRRKMRPFEGFQRKAVVIVPTDEEYKNRCAKREKEEGKEVPDSAVLEMKANFKLPEEGQLFDSVEYIELPKDDAVKLVEKYNKEGNDALPPEKRFQRNDQRGFQPRDRYTGGGGGYQGNRYDNRNQARGGYAGGGGYQDKREFNDRRSGGSYQVERRGGDRRSWGDSSRGAGNWRDNRTDNRNRSQSGGYDNRSSSRSGGSWSGGSGGGGGGGKWAGQHGGSGSWGGQGGSQGSWNQGGSWGGGNQGWGNQQGTWGQQGWGSGGGGQWNNYNQQNQNWNQGYNYGNWGNQGNWGNYQPGSQQGSWGNYSSGGYSR